MHIILHAYKELRIIATAIYAKQKQPGCKKVRGQSEATMVTSD